MSITNRHGSPFSAGRFDEARLMAETAQEGNSAGQKTVRIG
jgi:hypothetical protein